MRIRAMTTELISESARIAWKGEILISNGAKNPTRGEPGTGPQGIHYDTTAFASLKLYILLSEKKDNVTRHSAM